ncbi:MAG: hypothetical protein IPH62_04520 [Ignavibacteriae bacterium]|nr:hypothetical protein [Ignavibacteriota bacterium]
MKKQNLLFIFFFSSVFVVNAQVEKKIIEGTLAENTQIANKNIVDKYAKVGGVNYTQATNVATYNFTAPGAAYKPTPTSPEPMVEVEPGVWAMIAGDANSDGGVYLEDFASYQLNQGVQGYLNADFNMDGGVYLEDFAIYQLNQGKQTLVP